MKLLNTVSKLILIKINLNITPKQNGIKNSL
jgi:hypothetical protein